MKLWREIAVVVAHLALMICILVVVWKFEDWLNWHNYSGRVTERIEQLQHERRRGALGGELGY